MNADPDSNAEDPWQQGQRSGSCGTLNAKELLENVPQRSELGRDPYGFQGELIKAPSETINDANRRL